MCITFREKRSLVSPAMSMNLSYLDYVVDCDAIIYQPVARKNLENTLLATIYFGKKQKRFNISSSKIAPTKT